MVRQTKTVASNPKAIRALVCSPDKKQEYYLLAKDFYLYVSVGKAGNKSFVYRRWWKNTTRQEFLLNFPEELDDVLLREKIKEAKGKAAEFHSTLEMGSYSFEQKDAAKAEPTLRVLFETYMERYASKHQKRTVGEMPKDFERWFARSDNKKFRYADLKASEITTQMADDLHAYLGSVRGPKAANRAAQLARAVYNRCMKLKEYRGENPFSCITLFPEEPRNRFLTANEGGAIMRELMSPAACIDRPSRDLRDFVLLDMLTGVRKMNLLSAAWKEFDLQSGRWTIPAHKMKGGREQVVPLGGNEIALLVARQQFLQEGGKELPEFLFPGEGRTGHIMTQKKSWTTLRRRLGFLPVKPHKPLRGASAAVIAQYNKDFAEYERQRKDTKLNVTTHDLRRSLASAMANANVNIALVKSAMAHSDIKTTLRVYAHTDKPAELAAKQTAHEVWLRAAGLLEKPSKAGTRKRRKSS